MGELTVPKLGLSMIVRNEATCIKRCLDSVKGIISHWTICDTGSRDGTQELIRDHLKGIPGQLFQDEWVDFSHNRNLALARARGKADFQLLLDADITVEVGKGFTPQTLTADAYFLQFSGPIEWRVIRLIRDRLPWRFHGAAHEVLQCEVSCEEAFLPDIVLKHHEDGGSRPGRFERYLQLLLEDHRKEPNNSRHVFYIAQTYKDTERHQEALDWYERRGKMGGWDEEVWYSLYQRARCKLALNHSRAEVVEAFLNAYQARPWRLEPLLPLCLMYRAQNEFALAHLFSRPALDTPFPDDSLFVERAVYDYALLMEHAIACYWINDHEQAIRLNDQLLALPHLPANYHASAFRNRELSRQMIGS